MYKCGRCGCEMIVVEQVTRRHERGWLQVRFTDTDGTERRCLIDLEDLSDWLLQLKKLTGRKPTKRDLRDILVQMIEEVRKRRERFRPEFDLTDLIGVDLEREEK